MPHKFFYELKKFIILRARTITVFLLAGLTAFFLECQIILISVETLGINPYLSRCISLPIGIVFTWYFNRTFGFRILNSPNISEFLRFLKSTLVAQTVNFLLYIFLITFFDACKENPIIALLASVTAATIISFGLYVKYVFK